MIQWWDTLKFAHTWMLYALIALPFLAVAFFYFSRAKSTEVKFSSFDNFKGYTPGIKQRLSFLPYVLKLLAIGFVIIALARPQSSSSGRNQTTEGIDIVLALDISKSMLAEDLKPNRIASAKKVAEQFIDSRPNDRIGLVVFGGESFTQCPLTTDHAVLKNLIAAVESGMLADGTALGEGLATAVNRLMSSKAKSKVIILLTDGVNNVGAIAPGTAGDIARTFGIRVYTIGAGTTGLAPYPFQTPFGIQYQSVEVKIDEDVLKQIADETGGKYFRATSTNKLKDVYSEIDKLEKTKINVTEFSNKTEEFYPFALAALALLILESILKYTVFKSIP